MKPIKRGLLAVALIGVISLAPAACDAGQPFVAAVYAHGQHHGGGGHDNCGGSYDVDYYYCNGHAAHQHTDGVCPYASTESPCTVSKNTIKKVQKKLNHLGYDCGKADGVMGAKTKKALKKFQKENGLKANGAIKKATLKALGCA